MCDTFAYAVHVVDRKLYVGVRPANPEEARPSKVIDVAQALTTIRVRHKSTKSLKALLIKVPSRDAFIGHHEYINAEDTNGIRVRCFACDMFAYIVHAVDRELYVGTRLASPEEARPSKVIDLAQAPTKIRVSHKCTQFSVFEKTPRRRNI